MPWVDKGFRQMHSDGGNPGLLTDGTTVHVVAEELEADSGAGSKEDPLR